jgi:4-hydroxybenzoate polyprenyltransferase
MKAYLSLVKFAHTLFALPFAILAFVLGTQVSDRSGYAGLFVLVILCMVFARSAAMAFNRYIDREIDAINQRTRIREIPAGVITPANALRFTGLMALAFVVTTWFINPLCFALSPVALLVILGYSFTKRFTWLCHLVLGLGLGLAPVGAYLAVTGRFDVLPVLYGIMVMCWVGGFDILYALQDETFDREQGLHSMPGRFGKTGAIRISRSLHVACAMLLVVIGIMQSRQLDTLDWLHWVGTAAFMGLLVRQHWLVAKHDLGRINQAFFESNGMASLFYGAAVVMDLLTNF